MDSIKKDLQEASDANSDFEITQKKGPRSLAENLHVKKTKQFAENNATQIMGDNITLRTKKDDQNHSSKTDDYFPLRDDISCQFITMIPSLPIKPPLRPDFAARNDENEFPALVDNEEEEIHPLDGIEPATATKWYYRQGKIRCNRKGNIEFSVVELEFMEEDYKTILQDPDLEEEDRKCNVRFLSSSSVDIGEWEFAVHVNATKAIGNCCQSTRVNQSILNGILNLNLTDEQAKIVRVPFLQISGIYGQMLLEDLVNGFYFVFPGASFELPTKLSQIHKLSRL
ncbi:4210_t:CDS:2 [Rhizophagus irregularis]|nr:4210_t:CDS:2 [Rhizophagus irregularis]